jgi:hypothetical protein
MPSAAVHVGQKVHFFGGSDKKLKVYGKNRKMKTIVVEK